MKKVITFLLSVFVLILIVHGQAEQKSLAGVGLTNCSAFSLPFFEDFESGSASLNCWTTYDLDGYFPNWGLQG